MRRSERTCVTRTACSTVSKAGLTTAETRTPVLSLRSRARSTAPRYTGAAPVMPVASAARSSRSRRPAAETVLHSFEVGSGDGKNPRAGLIDVMGTLYGTTVNGGGASCYCGTVFKVTLSGAETVLYSFAGNQTASARMRASSTSTARSTARPLTAAQTAMEPSSRSRPPARKPCSTASQVHQTVHTHTQAS